MPQAEAVVLKRILLNLRAVEGVPDGSARHGYDVVAPLDPARGTLDLAAWRHAQGGLPRPALLGGREERSSDTSCTGPAARAAQPGRSTTTRARADDDEAGYRFGDHVFAPGEYVSIRDEDGRPAYVQGDLGPGRLERRVGRETSGAVAPGSATMAPASPWAGVIASASRMVDAPITMPTTKAAKPLLTCR